MKGKTIKWLSPYIHSEPIEYEEYFEKLALRGWHPAKIDVWSSIRMTFIKSEPKQYRYVVDVQSILRQEYKQLHQDLGWELVGMMSSVVVWRKEYDGSRPESFSDKESLERRNRKFSMIIRAIFFVFFVCSVLATIGIPILYILIPNKNRDMIDIIASVASIITIDIFTVFFGLALKKTKQKKRSKL